MIRYHGLPLTPVADMLRVMQSRHAMVSFARADQMAEASEVCQSVAIDNGAFSAWRAGAGFDFAGYEEFVGRWLRHPAVDWAIIPDIIDGNEAKNDALIWSWPFPTAVSVPVFHLHESLERLKFLCGRFPRVALGSSGEYATPDSERWWQRIAQLMPVVCDDEGHPRVKLHGLRMLKPVIFSHVPLSSADSTNVARNVRYDSAWRGPYAPASRWVKALIIMDRIDSHASARRWTGAHAGVQENMELIG